MSIRPFKGGDLVLVLVHVVLAFAKPGSIGAAVIETTVPFPAEIAHYPLARDASEVLGNNPLPQVQNVTFSPCGMELNGFYQYGGSDLGFVSQFPVPALNFDSLAVAVDLLPEDFNPEPPRSAIRSHLTAILGWLGMPFPDPISSHKQILSLGRGFRYISLKPNAGGLTVTLNNNDLRIPVPGTSLSPGCWHRVVVSLDAQARRLLLALDGNPAVSSTLPRDWTPNIRELSGSKLEAEREFCFTDYGTGGAYHGAAADLRIFGRAISPQEMAAIAADRGWERRPLRPFTSRMGNKLTLVIPLLILFCLIGGLAWHLQRKRRLTPAPRG